MGNYNKNTNTKLILCPTNSIFLFLSQILFSVVASLLERLPKGLERLEKVPEEG